MRSMAHCARARRYMRAASMRARCARTVASVIRTGSFLSPRRQRPHNIGTRSPVAATRGAAGLALGGVERMALRLEDRRSPRDAEARSATQAREPSGTMPPPRITAAAIPAAPAHSHPGRPSVQSNPPSPVHVSSGRGPQIPDAAPGVDVRELLRREWLLTDGLGGFAMGTALGAPMRRYHALCVESVSPPIGRVATLCQTVDRYVPGEGESEGGAGQAVDLSTFRFGDELLHPAGWSRLESFERLDPMTDDDGPACRWAWRVGSARITRTLRLRWGVGGAALTYTLTGGAPGSGLRITPLVRMASVHDLLRGERHIGVEQRSAGAVVVRHDDVRAAIEIDAGRFALDRDWWRGFRYDIERDRGYDDTEDLFAAGEFIVEADARGEARATLTCALLREGDAAPSRSLTARRDHLRAVVGAMEAHAPGSDRLAPLVQAADDFVVQRALRNDRFTTIIAGYPWFSDWGRDAMIALPGLLLTTRRFDDAQRTLAAFGAHTRRGLVPNCFDDRTGDALYNSVDASLWYLHAACEFAKAATADGPPALPGPVLEACLSIVDHFMRGTDFGIGVDERDGLLCAGDASTQLTWMDAKRDGVVFTPRFGKCVELNALWVHALRGVAALRNDGARVRCDELLERAERAAESFRRAFWRERLGCLCDRLVPEHGGADARWVPVDEVRPNQLFAASLERSPLTLEQRRGVVGCARERLLTPYGVRTLAPGSPGYVPRYRGTMFERDRAYHNGTAWPWLLGAYCEGALRAGEFSESARAEALRAITPIVESTGSGCLGQIAEVYDAEGDDADPQHPDGCPAQAWSVAEALRISAMLSG
ncbi:MAG: hypothetical protein EA379_09470 [Phycisphaerales bacterium]|nr:MAG: hypothetical protein EA379_09470 [Phycisphaerales bacterium]